MALFSNLIKKPFALPSIPSMGAQSMAPQAPKPNMSVPNQSMGTSLTSPILQSTPSMGTAPYRAVAPATAPSPMSLARSASNAFSIKPPQSPAPIAPVAPPKPAVPRAPAPASSITSDGQNINPSTGGIASIASVPPTPATPPAPEAPVTAPEATRATFTPPTDYSTSPELTAAQEAYKASLQMSPEEQAKQAEIDRLASSYAEGAQNIEDQTIPLQFITGQQRSLENRFLNQKNTLEAQAARLQAKRLATLEANKFSLEQEAKRLENLQTRNTPTYSSVEGNIVRINPATGKAETVFSAPKDTAGFTLGTGERRYDAKGNLIASGAPKPDALSQDAARILTPSEAESLGVPYGTTAGQAYGKSVTGTPTAEQSKARQFAVSAENANKDLASSTYYPGIVKDKGWFPNFLKSSERQKFEQASRAFVNATLRRESGATITDDEFQNKYRELIPQAGDKPEVLKQKELARAAAVKSIQEAGGGVIEQGQNFTPEELEYIRSSGVDPSQISFNNVGSDTKLGALKKSIITQESGGNYKAVGIPTQYGQALGKYQIMGFHLPKVGLQDTSAGRQQFLNSPQLQDKLFEIIIDDLAKKYNNDPKKIAAAYYGGAGGVQKLGTSAGNTRYQGGKSPSINEYVNSVISRIS